MDTNLLAYGSLQSFPKSTVLTAGELTMLYESGFLRYISHGDTEVVRMINLTVRDQFWNTIPQVIVSEKIESSNDSFTIEYEARCKQGVIDFRWNVIIHGNLDSTITFSATGKALSAFQRNRVGITVLHPIKTCTGKNCLITHPDQTTQTEQFPLLINPVQPFFDIRSMAWSPAEGINAAVHFDGDVFETEDQRNWLDASYKTYCTPVSRPMPVDVHEGDEVIQSVRLHVDGPGKKSLPSQQPITFTLEKGKRFRFPKIGVPISRLPHSKLIIDLLRALPVDFLRVEVNVTEPEYASTLQEAGNIASALNRGLEVVLFANENTTDDFIQHLVPLSKQLLKIILLPAREKSTDAKLIRNTVPLLRKQFPHCKIGGGTDGHFTELNRSRTPTENLDFLIFSVTPQAHAVDIRTMTETLQNHPDVVRSCREFAGEKGIEVGPITLKTRPKSNTTSRALEGADGGTLPSYADPRQLSLFAAGWTMGSIKYLAESQAEAITYFQTCGWGGLMTHPGEQWPQEFAVSDGTVYPAYLLLKELLQHKKDFIIPLITTHPLLVDGLALLDDAGIQNVVLANFTNEAQFVQLPPDLHKCKLRTLIVNTIEGFMKDPETLVNLPAEATNEQVILPPFAVAFISR